MSNEHESRRPTVESLRAALAGKQRYEAGMKAARERADILEEGLRTLLPGGERCPHDTNGDGDCHLCYRRPGGCTESPS